MGTGILQSLHTYIQRARTCIPLIRNAELAEDGVPLTGLLVHDRNARDIVQSQAADLNIRGCSHHGMPARWPSNNEIRRWLWVHERCANTGSLQQPQSWAPILGLLQWTGSEIVLGGSCKGVTPLSPPHILVLLPPDAQFDMSPWLYRPCRTVLPQCSSQRCRQSQYQSWSWPGRHWSIQGLP